MLTTACAPNQSCSPAPCVLGIPSPSYIQVVSGGSLCPRFFWPLHPGGCITSHRVHTKGLQLSWTALHPPLLLMVPCCPRFPSVPSSSPCLSSHWCRLPLLLCKKRVNWRFLPNTGTWRIAGSFRMSVKREKAANGCMFLIDSPFHVV